MQAHHSPFSAATIPRQGMISARSVLHPPRVDRVQPWHSSHVSCSVQLQHTRGLCSSNTGHLCHTPVLATADISMSANRALAAGLPLKTCPVAADNMQPAKQQFWQGSFAKQHYASREAGSRC
jgi:hypothetical protein